MPPHEIFGTPVTDIAAWLIILAFACAAVYILLRIIRKFDILLRIIRKFDPFY